MANSTVTNNLTDKKLVFTNNLTGYFKAYNAAYNGELKMVKEPKKKKRK